MATPKTYQDGTSKSDTDTYLHNIVAWRILAEVVCQYLKKGNLIYFEGEIKTRSFGVKEGMKKYVTEIVAKNLIMLDKAELKFADKAEIYASFDKVVNLRKHRCYGQG